MLPEIMLSRSVHISTWGLLVSAAAVVVLCLGRVNARARGLTVELVESAWPWLILGGFCGAHLYYLLAVAHWPLHPLALRQVMNVFDGTAVQGGLLGGAGAAGVFFRRKRRALLPFCDALAPAGALAQAVTRLGCLAAGCCYGRPTSLFLGVVYTSPLADPSAPRGVALHPAQLYEAVLDAGLGAFLQSRLRRMKHPGQLFALYLAGAGLIRFVTQFFRDDDSGRLVWGLAHSQFTSLAMIAASLALYRLVRTKEQSYGIS